MNAIKVGAVTIHRMDGLPCYRTAKHIAKSIPVKPPITNWLDMLRQAGQYQH